MKINPVKDTLTISNDNAAAAGHNDNEAAISNAARPAAPNLNKSEHPYSALFTDDTLEIGQTGITGTGEDAGWLWSAVEAGLNLASKVATSTTKWYHDYQASGLDNIPKSGPALMVLNHSLATYDVALLATEIAEKTGRSPRIIVDRMFFKFPGLSHLAKQGGLVEASRENARKLLNDGELVIVLPGGMKEALKPSTEKYEIQWATRKGFVRMALETGAPIVMGACPAADDIYTVYNNPVTRAAYDYLRLPAPVFAGRYYTGVPMAAKLSHVVSKPVPMPKLPKDRHLTDAFIDGKHKQILKAMDSTMTDALVQK